MSVQIEQSECPMCDSIYTDITGATEVSVLFKCRRCNYPWEEYRVNLETKVIKDGGA